MKLWVFTTTVLDEEWKVYIVAWRIEQAFELWKEYRPDVVKTAIEPDTIELLAEDWHIILSSSVISTRLLP